MEKVRELLETAISKALYQVILSNPRNRDEMEKIKIRPVLVKNQMLYQETVYIGTQVFHNNYEKRECVDRICHCLEQNFRQGEISCQSWQASVLISKKGKVTIKKKMTEKRPGDLDLSHNRTKDYILKEGVPVPFLIDLGVQAPDGRILKARYDKFKQINRFLEFIQDLLPTLKKKKKWSIIDFGCGKSYLTFAVYYYLKIIHGLEVYITGLDLKKDVIKTCNELAEKYGYENLHFQIGDISSYQEEGTDVDMVITLHACDTATDYALAKAVEWGAEIILSVPCCQHEVNRMIRSECMQPLLKYGLLKERFSALCTDAVRAGILEVCGYEVQILEFIDMTHTPKNILIRAVKSGRKKHMDNTAVDEMSRSLNIQTSLQKWYLENMNQ